MIFSEATSTQPSTPPPPLAFGWATVVCFAAGYIGLALFGPWLSLGSGRHATVVLSGGLYMAMLLSSERQHWLKWAAAVFVLESLIEIALFHEGVSEGFADATAHAAGALAGAHLIRVCRGLPFQLNKPSDTVAFSVATTLVSSTVAVALNVLLLYAAGHNLPAREWLIYWTGGAAGTLVVAPLLLALRQHAPAWRTVSLARWLEAAVLFGLLALVLHAIFSNPMPTVYLSLPLILWASARMGMPGITLMMLVYLLVIVRYSAMGLGPYGHLESAPMSGTILGQSFLVLSVVSALCLSAIISQYKQAQLALRQARDELEQRVAERTAALGESERQLRESNAQFAVARAAARMIIIEWHIPSGTLTFSDDPAWLRGPLPATGHYPRLRDQVHPDDQTRFLQTRSGAVETLQGYTLDYRVVRTDGMVLWVQSHQTMIAGADGKAERLLSATQDISARKQIEASLREAEQRVRALLDGIPDRAWMKDAAGRYIAVNRACAEGFGVRQEQMIGKTIYEMRPHKVARQVDAEDAMVMAHAKPMRIERPSNTLGKWVEMIKTPIFGANGQYAGIVGIWRDITVRKQAEHQALEASEQRYRTLVDATSHAVWILDAQGNLQTMLKSITGVQPNTVTDQTWLQFVYPDDRAAAADAMRAAIASNDTFEHEHRIANRDGDSWHVLSRAVPVRHADGSVREWMGTSIDVTARVHAQQALRESNLMLRRLSGRREELLEAERARIAHNLHDGAGQSLNVVRMKLAAVLRGATPDAAVQTESLMKIQDIVDQINQEIRSLEFELSPPVLRQLGLVPALGWLGEEMQRTYGLDVHVSDDGEDKPLGQAHRASVFRAVRELLINVVKHAKVNTAHVDAQRVQQAVLVTVSDTGVGFDTSNIELLESSGLGLTGVRERIEFAGGGIRFISEPGAGTVITLTMPLIEEK